MNKKKCPICGTEMKIDTSAVCTSIPPKFRCVCPSCNCLDFIETSEYDQYKEEPYLSSNLDDAAIDAAQLDMQDRQIMEATNDERLRYSRIFRRGFKAGAEWLAGQMPKWKPAARAYEGDRLPRIDWSLNRLVARFEEGIFYLDIRELYKLPGFKED